MRVGSKALTTLHLGVDPAPCTIYRDTGAFGVRQHLHLKTWGKSSSLPAPSLPKAAGRAVSRKAYSFDFKRLGLLTRADRFSGMLQRATKFVARKSALGRADFGQARQKTEKR